MIYSKKKLEEWTKKHQVIVITLEGSFCFGIFVVDFLSFVPKHPVINRLHEMQFLANLDKFSNNLKENTDVLKLLETERRVKSFTNY